MPDQGDALKRKVVIDEIMDGRLARIEEKYADKLQEAGRFDDTFPRPKPKQEKKKKEEKSKNGKTKTDKVYAEDEDVVAINVKDGEVDTNMNITDAMKKFKLTEETVADGLVAARNADVIAATGFQGKSVEI